MKRILITTSLLTASIFLSCSRNSKIQQEEKILNSFNEWLNRAYLEKKIVDSCSDNETLDKSLTYPKDYSISYGDFNDDGIKDALISFSTRTCEEKKELSIHSNFSNPKKIVLLVLSKQNEYEINEKDINIHELELAIEKEYQCSRCDIYLNEIYGQSKVTGFCKIWSNEHTKNFQGYCCPNIISLITIDINAREIYLHKAAYEYVSDGVVRY